MMAGVLIRFVFLGKPSPGNCSVLDCSMWLAVKRGSSFFSFSGLLDVIRDPCVYCVSD